MSILYENTNVISRIIRDETGEAPAPETGFLLIDTQVREITTGVFETIHVYDINTPLASIVQVDGDVMTIDGELIEF